MFVYTLLSTQLSLGFLSLAIADSSSEKQEASISEISLRQVGTMTTMLVINVRPLYRSLLLESDRLEPLRIGCD